MAPVIFIDQNFYVIGGHADGIAFDLIGRLDAKTRTWSIAGKLAARRDGHNAIFHDSKLIVVGGWGEIETETCTLSNYEFLCYKTKLILDTYVYYPELYQVPDDFCKAPP